MKRYKFLFVGLGSIGQRHVRNLRALWGSNIELLAVRQRGASPLLNPDMTVQLGKTIEEAYDIRSLTELDEALAEEPDAVFITNPNSLHMPVALAAARAGRHLFIEKPISHSMAGVEELISLVEQQGLVAFVAYQFRFHPGLQSIKRWLEDGRLGRLVAAHIVNGERLPDWHPYEDYRGTHPARRELGGGCLQIQTHEIDYALWMFGMPKRVFAVGGHLSRLEVDVEDSVSLLMECEHNGRPLPVHIHLDYLQRPPQRVCEIVGDAGKVRYDYYTNRIDLFDVETRIVESINLTAFNRDQMFYQELEHFMSCLQGESLPQIDLREGRRSMLISQAAARSLETKQAEMILESSL